jgi:hypothetical protein
MKRIILLLPLLLFALGCNPGQQGVQETVYPAANNAPSNSGDPEITTVKVAVIALDDGGKNGLKIGCNDSVVYITKTIPPTTQPLNEAMKQLFALNSEIVRGPDSDQEFYNVIPKMENLKFDHATLVNGYAKVYLTGSFAGLGGVCDSPRVQAQIEETANQYQLILETYLNGKKVDWQKFSSQR